MNKLQMSPAAAGLLRALLARAGVDRDRFLLTGCRSTDWQSLTFVGERHQLSFRIRGPDAEALLARFRGSLEESEFVIRGEIVADIAVEGTPERNQDGSILVAIEALTIAE